MSERMKELKIMRTTMRYIVEKGYRLIAIGLLAVLPALMGAWQAQAVTYKNSYNGGISHQPSSINYQAPAAITSFQSTSAYSGQWNGQTSMLNADGSVNSEAYMGQSNGPLKAPGGGSGPGGNGPGTPGGDLDPTTQQPLGDAVLPLLLMALAYALHSLVLRRRRNTLL